MGNRRISPDMKFCALRLWNSGWTVDDIIETLRISRSSIYRWQNILLKHGDVVWPRSPLIGRTRIIARAVLRATQDLYAEESDLYLDEIVTWLALEHDVAVSTSTLSRNLEEAGLTRKILHKIAKERDEQLRLDYRASEDFCGDGSEFVCVDETSKNELTYARRYGRSMSGEQAHLTDVFVRGDRYSLIHWLLPLRVEVILQHMRSQALLVVI
jgi:transposase